MIFIEINFDKIINAFTKNFSINIVKKTFITSMLHSALVWLGREHLLLCELSKEQDGRRVLLGVGL